MLGFFFSLLVGYLLWPEGTYAGLEGVGDWASESVQTSLARTQKNSGRLQSKRFLGLSDESERCDHVFSLCEGPPSVLPRRKCAADEVGKCSRQQLFPRFS
jgi:hypothetical protein